MTQADPLWRIAELAVAVDGALKGAPRADITGVSIDSRTIAPGEAFFAIRGANFDGHDFVDAALANGAGVAVIAADLRDKVKMANAPLLLVDDVLAALEAAGRAARARSTARIVAVTGSVGKTSTKEALKLALTASGPTHASPASFNNHWGVPLSLARLDRHVPYAIFEIGMNHAGEIETLVDMVKPHAAIVTTVEAVHIEHLGSIEAIADAKAEIFSGVLPGGIAIINIDNPWGGRLRRAARQYGLEICTFGTDAAADCRLHKMSLRADCSSVSATIRGHEATYKVGAPGRHLVMNSLAVLAAVDVLGADLALGALALQDLSQPAGRGLRHQLRVGDGHATLIDESYNANPASVSAALDLLARSPVGPKGRRIAVLGDMLELGEDADRLHAALAMPIAQAGVDLVFAAGEHMRALAGQLPVDTLALHQPTAIKLREQLLSSLRAGDVVMIKGSLGSKMAPLVAALLERYPPVAADLAAQ